MNVIQCEMRKKVFRNKERGGTLTWQVWTRWVNQVKRIRHKVGLRQAWWCFWLLQVLWFSRIMQDHLVFKPSMETKWCQCCQTEHIITDADTWRNAVCLFVTAWNNKSCFCSIWRVIYLNCLTILEVQVERKWLIFEPVVLWRAHAEGAIDLLCIGLNRAAILVGF